MILFNLRCAEGHDFEAWFRDGEAWETRGAGSVSCPLCGGTDITKAPMAPRIGRHRGEPEPAPVAIPPAELAGHLRQLRKTFEDHCDYVGDRFAEEARKIHYGESKPRDIYGEASKAEAEELLEEGVTFQRIPVTPRTNS
ncbi:MAG: DUF1178 family protein [Rhodospirillaceae bacterium]